MAFERSLALCPCVSLSPRVERAALATWAAEAWRSLASLVSLMKLGTLALDQPKVRIEKNNCKVQTQVSTLVTVTITTPRLSKNKGPPKMAKKSKLLAALDAQKGRDFKKEHHKKMQKQAERRKKTKPVLDGASEDESEAASGAQVDGTSAQLDAESEGWETDESEAALTAVGEEIFNQVELDLIDNTLG